MRLSKVKLFNFRGYQSLTEVHIHKNLTGILGQNDVGKSTILEALAIFFEVEGVKPDKNDMNCFSSLKGEEFFEITCEFDDLPDQILIDDSAFTTFESEYLLNKDKNLEIVKRFKKTTGKVEKTFIRCIHPKGELSKLLGLKLSQLKELGKDVTDKVDDKRIAAQWRQAIRESAKDLECSELLLDVDKDLSTDTKPLWGHIQQQLPTFALFKADRESSDSDLEAKNPLQQAVKAAQAEFQSEIDALEVKIQERVMDVAQRTLDKLREMSPDLANELNPKFREKPKWTFNFSLEGENGIPINKRGSGVRRLILLNFFRAEAEKNINTKRNVIYAIEEPETSQHPNYQMLLMKSLLALSYHNNRQIIITTHVPALAGLIPQESVRYITKSSSVPVVQMPSEDVLKQAAESLGVLPELGMEKAKGVVLVEGKSDVTFLRHASKVLSEAGYVKQSLDEAKIVPLVIGGCGSVKHWVTLNLANDLGLPWCVFLDSDVGGDSRQENSIRKRKSEVEEKGKKCFITRKREIENYISPDLVQELTGQEVGFDDFCDAKKKISRVTKVKADDVMDKFWPQMNAERIVSCSTYNDSSGTKVEIIEILEGILSIVKS